MEVTVASRGGNKPRDGGLRPSACTLRRRDARGGQAQVDAHEPVVPRGVQVRGERRVAAPHHEHARLCMAARVQAG